MSLGSSSRSKSDDDQDSEIENRVALQFLPYNEENRGDKGGKRKEGPMTDFTLMNFLYKMTSSKLVGIPLPQVVPHKGLLMLFKDWSNVNVAATLVPLLVLAMVTNPVQTTL
jgi:hypothetical protein